MIRLLLAALPFCLASCFSPMGGVERRAQDRIMLVREDPPTLGVRRLRQQASTHHDLAAFIRERGDPDFIAETSSDDRQYLILYYLHQRQAWACRSWRDQGEAIEFAGPYEITKKESEILAALKKNSVQSTRSGIAHGQLVTP
ncbi:hypothetical protein HNR46_001138 [Haloferula luteola]|uniref:Uncharacterized protein n=1 Tax=Haloferula luteola TaxID=595692 RepID=A0A840V5K2_9BACT|nr:hypothetical protein [Haloferula luteola]MBB5350904.1 hypothetical protein [Haloferula luteola]